MVRPRSATPLFVGSNPTVTSKQKGHQFGVLVFCCGVLCPNTISAGGSGQTYASAASGRSRRLVFVAAVEKSKGVPPPAGIFGNRSRAIQIPPPQSTKNELLTDRQKFVFFMLFGRF